MEVLYSDDVEAIRQYLSTPEGIQNINNEHQTKFTPLHHACKNNLNDVVDVLIEFGVNVNLLIPLVKHSPLHIACMEGYIDIVRRLLDAGADATIDNWRKQTPIMFAARNGYLDIVKLLTIYTDFNHTTQFGNNIFTCAIRSKNNEMIDYVYDFCTEINHTDFLDGSYLHEAVESENIYAIKFLLNKGININIQDYNGKKASDLTQDPEILNLLTQQ